MFVLSKFILNKSKMTLMFGILSRPASTANLASQPPSDWWWCLTVTHCMLRGEGHRDPSSCFSWRLEEVQLLLVDFVLLH